MTAGRIYEFGPFRLDAGGHLLFRNGQRLALTPKAVELLIALVEARGNPVGKEELLQKVWADTSVEEGTLTSHVSLLRKALGEGAGGPQYIETISKRGYRFVSPVRIADGLSPEPVLDRRTQRFAPSRRSRIVLMAVVAVLVLLAAYIPARRLLARPQRQTGRQMIVVLPVQNLTGNPDEEYISDGLTEELIAQLSSINGDQLGVIARTSAMSYKGTNKKADQIGHELGVDYILESSLRGTGDRIRATAQLVRVRDQTHLWSQSYDRTMSDAVALQAEVAHTIAAEIQVQLASLPDGRTTPRQVNPEAYKVYLQGRYHWNKRSREMVLRSIAEFNHAIEIDAGYPQAYVGLADSYTTLVLLAEPRPEEFLEKARSAALQALRLDSSLAEAHASLAYVKFYYDWDWAGAEAEFRRAIELNPGYATAHQRYAEYLRLMGREQEAITEGQKALELDPLSLIINMELGLPYYFLGQYDTAISHFRKALELDPDFALAHCVLGWALMEKGDPQSAIRELEQARRLDGTPAILSALAQAYADAGKKSGS